MNGLTLIACDLAEPERARAEREATRATGRPVELIALAAEPNARASVLRNRGLARAAHAYVAFIDPASDLGSSFLEHACRLLDRRAVAFVTAWADALPLADDSQARACEPAWLLERPWFAHVPSVMRRSSVTEAGAYDESLAACEDADLLLRLTARGGGVAVVDAQPRQRPWGPGVEWDHDDAPAAFRRFYEKHAAAFAAEWERVLVGKERLARELFAHRRQVDARWQELHAELSSVRGELARARAELSRLEGR